MKIGRIGHTLSLSPTHSIKLTAFGNRLFFWILITVHYANQYIKPGWKANAENIQLVGGFLGQNEEIRSLTHKRPIYHNHMYELCCGDQESGCNSFPQTAKTCSSFQKIRLSLWNKTERLMKKTKQKMTLRDHTRICFCWTKSITHWQKFGRINQVI